jgi:hypothetical protein
MKIACILILYLLLASSCNYGYKFWNISKFNIVDSALTDGEEIKLLYSSRGPDNNEDKEYYIHIVAVSQKTGDTVNILTTINDGFSMYDKDKILNYLDQNNVASKLFQIDSDKLKDLKNINEINKSETKKITKVARAPNFDSIADNIYPTVLGIIGTLSK